MMLVLIMTSVIAICYWLEEHTRWAAHVSGVLLIIIIASMLGVMGVVPTSEAEYGAQFHWIVPLAIILMLFAFNPKDILAIDQDFLWCFVIGIIGTSIGGLVAGLVFKKILPDDYWRVSGQLTASFIGGYENAVAVGKSLETPIPTFLKVFAGDSIITSFWIIYNIFQGRGIVNSGSKLASQKEGNEKVWNSIDVTSIAITATLAFVILNISLELHKIFPGVSQLLFVSVFATLLTFTPLRHRFIGSYAFGSFLLSYFIFQCGAVSNTLDLFKNASILILFPAIILLVHAIILFGMAKILKIKKDIVIVTSQCLIGGPATALAVVTARRWDYKVEAISLGLLGYAVGNYFGFLIAYALK